MWLIVPVLLVGIGCATAARLGWLDGDSAIPVHGYRVVKSLPHDTQSFTQGLLFCDGVLYESTGKTGLSRVRRINPETGEVMDERRLPADVFGEGLTDVEDRLIQLTWKAGKAYVYDRATLERRPTLRYEGEGWGLTYDGRYLILSDGTSILRFLDSETLTEHHTVQVRAAGKPVKDLNELEWIDGRIWANVWKSDRIARIHPRTGEVESWIDLEGLHPRRAHHDDVLNGIAWDAGGKRLFVSGKRWDTMYQIEVTDPPE